MQIPRHFLLSQQPGRVVRLLSGMADPPADKPRSWVTVTREGSFTDPRWGRFEISRAMLLAMVANFEQGVVGTDIFLDVNHQPGAGAAARICKLAVEGGRLRALVEWTDYGRAAVRERGFRYLSAEFSENWQDNEQGRYYGPVLLGAGLTVRPVIKRLDPVTLSCAADADTPVWLHPELLGTLLSEARHSMNQHLKQLLQALADKQLSQAAIDAVRTLAEQQLAGITDEQEALRLCSLLEQAAITLSARLGELPAGATAPVIQLSLANADSASIQQAVHQVLAERQTQQHQLAETADARRKLLADTIQAAPGLDDACKQQLSEAANALVDGHSTEQQVLALAALQISQGQQMQAARQLAALGYGPQGRPHISVPADGHKRLSELYRDALARSDMAHALHLDPATPLHPFASKVLAEFDRLNGYKLEQELKLLTQGQGSTDMSNTALPVGVQREVIREALSDLNVLALVQTLTDFGATATTQIPYELRDTSQVVNEGIVYEGQGIPLAGISQLMDTAYITPMKLALSISNEVMFFTRASALNWDALARNIESNARVLRELVHRRICNELQRAADSYLAITVQNEDFSAQADGTKSTIRLARWPLVRPFQARNLQGQAVMPLENAITVTAMSTQIPQWDGSGKQSGGLYWRVLSYNLGIIQFVNNQGTPAILGRGGSNFISYSAASNVSKFDLDAPAGMAQEKWLNGLIQKIGGRKAMLSSQRYVTPDFLLMSPTLNDLASNAEQFVVSLKRNGSDTNAQGDLQAIKDVPAFGTNAPGVDLGDERILMGRRGVAGYCVAKPFMTGEPFEQVNGQGQAIGKKMAYGEEYNAIVIPKPVRDRFTSVVVYSTTARNAL